MEETGPQTFDSRSERMRAARFIFIVGFMLLATMLAVPCVVIATTAIMDVAIAFLAYLDQITWWF